MEYIRQVIRLDTSSVLAGYRSADKSTLLSGSFQFLGAELKETADETLFLELARRGYDLSKLQENTEATAEIMKIG